MFWKNHHALGDGISLMSLLLGASADYDRSYFVPMPDAKWYEILFAKITVIFLIPKLLAMFLF